LLIVSYYSFSGKMNNYTVCCFLVILVELLAEGWDIKIVLAAAAASAFEWFSASLM